MTKTAIQVKRMGKKYSLGEHEPYSALRDVLTSPFKKKEFNDEFWALKNIDFEVKQGEVLGVIGRNGSGKSTLLKILSRITPPSSGTAILNGRVASLLEVGTGFSPELTGRENIFLNGSILGMSRREIKQKFDEIVNFSGVEKFIDTPVKRYSSGMYVRLAFAIAAHLESEILLVDEVLAVGDVDFQKKCLNKMSSLTGSGRTVLFVSHDMHAVSQLCGRAILLSDGSVKQIGKTNSTIRTYLNGGNGGSRKSIWRNDKKVFQNEVFCPTKFSATDELFQPLSTSVRADQNIFVNIYGDVSKVESNLMVGYRIFNEDNLVIYSSTDKDTTEEDWPTIKNGHIHLYSQIPNRLLRQGKYRLDLIVKYHGGKWIAEPNNKAPSIYIEIRGGSSDSPYWSNRSNNVITPIIQWHTK